MSLNPSTWPWWLVLLAGFLLGWLAEWLLELWFFRRRRLECQRKLAQVQADLRAREIEVGNLRAHADTLQADLTALSATRVKGPEVKVEGPKVDLAAPTLTVAAPKVEAPTVVMPKIEPKVEAPQVELPKVEVEAPQVELPKVDVKGSEVKLPEAGLVAGIGAGVAGALGALKAEGPQVEVETPAVELPKVDLAAPVVELPKVEVEAPQVELPKVDLAAPTVELPKVEAETPKVELPKVDLAAPVVDAPEVELPKVGLPEAGLPAAAGLGLAGLGGKLTGEAPTIERSVNWTAADEAEAPRVEVDWPKVGGAVEEVGATLPEAQPLAAEIKPPSIGAELPAAVGLTAGAVSVGLPEAVVEATQTPVAERSVNWTAVPPATDEADDLELIEGIGPVYAAKLRGAGIVTFAQLAAADEAQLARIVAAPSWRKTNYGEWIAQARLAAAGDEAGLAALQAELFKRHGDHLDLIAGIGSRTAEVLGGAGITSFAQLAETTPEKLDTIIKKADARGGDYAAWIAEAKLRAARKRVPHLRKVRTAAHVTSCPQDLSKLRGIGSVYEQKLYAAGIGTFWQLSQADDVDLTRILGIKDFQNVNLAEIKAAAAKMAEDTGTTDLTWDGSQPDDFEPLGGIGQVYEGRLYDAGICTYAALAAATVEQLAEICKAPAWRMPDYAGWIAQAKAKLTEGK